MGEDSKSHRIVPVQVLIIDDDPGDIELIREALDLNTFNANIHAVGSGEDALMYLRKEGHHCTASSPDLILLDLNMPGVDGRKALEEIRSDDAFVHIPIVVLTTSSAEKDIAKCYELGASSYVVKPLDLDSFEKVVQSIEDFWLSATKFPSDTLNPHL